MIEPNTIVKSDCLAHSDNIHSESVDLIITDPPWGCNAWDKGNYTDDEEYIKEKIPLWIAEFSRVLKPSCHIYIYVPTKYIENWLIPFKQHFKLNNILTAENMKVGKYYPNKFRNNQQMILYGSKGVAKNFNKSDFILTSDSWFKDKRNLNPERYTYKYPAYIPSYIKATVEESVGHPDEKNEILIRHLIEISSNPGELVVDFFMGCAPVAMASIKTKRSFFGYEDNPEYYKLCMERVAEVKQNV